MCNAGELVSYACACNNIRCHESYRLHYHHENMKKAKFRNKFRWVDVSIGSCAKPVLFLYEKQNSFYTHTHTHTHTAFVNDVANTRQKQTLKINFFMGAWPVAQWFQSQSRERAGFSAKGTYTQYYYHTIRVDERWTMESCAYECVKEVKEHKWVLHKSRANRAERIEHWDERTEKAEWMQWGEWTTFSWIEKCK